MATGLITVNLMGNITGSPSIFPVGVVISTAMPEEPEVSTVTGINTWIFELAGIISWLGADTSIFAFVGKTLKLIFAGFGKSFVRVIGML